ncbi:MAG: hypothetical protein J6X14_09945 [Lachnospiraceae bacterium]|nr:hypothetical protein [Lachnospiraceae bacterium]
MGKEAYRKPVMDVVELEDDMILTSTGQSCMDAGGGGITPCDCSAYGTTIPGGVTSGGHGIASGGSGSWISGGGTGLGCGVDMGGSDISCGSDQP